MSGHDQIVNPVTDIEESGELHKWWTRGAGACGKATAGGSEAGGGSHRIQDLMADKATAFGHGARKAYSSIQAWGAEIERKLEADWKEAGYEGDSAWEKVKAAVKQGWECCTTTGAKADHADGKPAHSGSPKGQSH